MNGMPGKRVSRLGILETLESAEGEESRFSFHYLYSYRDTDSKNIVLEWIQATFFESDWTRCCVRCKDHRDVSPWAEVKQIQNDWGNTDGYTNAWSRNMYQLGCFWLEMLENLTEKGLNDQWNPLAHRIEKSRSRAILRLDPETKRCYPGLSFFPVLKAAFCFILRFGPLMVPRWPLPAPGRTVWSTSSRKKRVMLSHCFPLNVLRTVLIGAVWVMWHPPPKKQLLWLGMQCIIWITSSLHVNHKGRKIVQFINNYLVGGVDAKDRGTSDSA